MKKLTVIFLCSMFYSSVLSAGISLNMGCGEVSDAFPLRMQEMTKQEQDYVLTRIAAAEFLAKNNVSDANFAKLLNGIVDGSYQSYKSLIESRQYKSYLVEILETSKAKQRIEFELAKEKTELELGNIAQFYQLSDVIAPKPIPLWKRILASIHSPFAKVIPLQFTSSLVRKIRETPELLRSRRFNRTLKHLPLITHHEAIQIINAFPAVHRTRVANIVKPKIFTPVRIYSVRSTIELYKLMPGEVRDIIFGDYKVSKAEFVEIILAKDADTVLAEMATSNFWKYEFSFMESLNEISRGKTLSAETFRFIVGLEGKDVVKLEMTEKALSENLLNASERKQIEEYASTLRERIQEAKKLAAEHAKREKEKRESNARAERLNQEIIEIVNIARRMTSYTKTAEVLNDFLARNVQVLSIKQFRRLHSTYDTNQQSNAALEKYFNTHYRRISYRDAITLSAYSQTYELQNKILVHFLVENLNRQKIPSKGVAHMAQNATNYTIQNFIIAYATAKAEHFVRKDYSYLAPYSATYDVQDIVNGADTRTKAENTARFNRLGIQF